MILIKQPFYIFGFCLLCMASGYYLCDFVVRDIKMALNLESPQKINFDLVSDFLSKWIFTKMGFNY